MNPQSRNPRNPTPLSSLLFGWTRQAWTIPLILLILIISGAGLYALETGMTRHPKFRLEHNPAFYAVFGFVSFSALVLSGWLVGRVLKRHENYYGEHDGQ